MYVNSLSTLFYHPCHSFIFDRDHLRPPSGIISGAGSFAVQFGDHLRSGIICSPIWGSFAVRDHFRSGIICSPIWGSFAVRDHLRSGIICGPGSFAVQFGDHLRSGIICGPVQYVVDSRLSIFYYVFYIYVWIYENEAKGSISRTMLSGRFFLARNYLQRGRYKN